MPGHVYAVASGKGGVGKTTTVINLGVTLRMGDYSVAMVDADLGMANLSTMLGIDHHPTIHDVLAGRAELAEAIVEEAPGFGVLPGARDLDEFADAEPSGLDRILEALADQYDYVLVDTASGLTHEAVLPLVTADGVILVTEPNRAAIGDTKKTAELVELVGGTVLGCVVTKSTDEVDAEGIARALGTRVLAEIPVDPAVPSSLVAEQPLQGHAPDGPAAAAYRQLADRLSADGIDIDGGSGGPSAGGAAGAAKAAASEDAAEGTNANDSEEEEIDVSQELEKAVHDVQEEADAGAEDDAATDEDLDAAVTWGDEDDEDVDQDTLDAMAEAAGVEPPEEEQEAQAEEATSTDGKDQTDDSAEENGEEGGSGGFFGRLRRLFG